MDTRALCCRCGNGLPDTWYWVKDAEGKLTGQGCCGGCAKKGEQPYKKPIPDAAGGR